MESIKSPSSGWKTWSTRKKSLVISSVILFIVALAVGLGVGLGLGLKDDDDDNDTSPPDDGGDTGNNNTVTWQPAVGTSWQIVLRYALNDTSYDVDVYDIDLFDNPKSMIDELHEQGRKVICYFSAGTYEDWRDDASDFPESDIGDDLDEWDGESWVNIRSEAIRDIMVARLDVAVAKGCDGVDPDNVDGYDNENGLDLTEDDTVDYMNWMSGEARKRGLSIGLKNAGAVISRVIGGMQWSVNEQCAQYDECDVYAAFVKGDKPVFHIEYPKGDEVNNEVEVGERLVREACDFGENGFSTLIKNMDLDNWVQNC
ncbi:glycoside hydrolase superfamily [Aspergillus karnatakaensis]|uniref:endo alpha-1,4 polygalactosaminidase n=1 Tax=Aspergillus karnatakaensis TaxID=1810916 RepID=UPI003CCE0F7E